MGKTKKGKKSGRGARSSASGSAAAAAAVAAGDFDALMALANDALARFAYEDACGLLQQALRIRPSDTDTMDLLGDILLTYLGEEEKGRAALQHSISIAPDSGHVKYFSLAQLEGGREGVQLYERGLANIARALTSPASPAAAAELQAAAAQACCAVAELWQTDLCMEDGAEAYVGAAIAAALGHQPNGIEPNYSLAQHRLRQQRMDEAHAAISRTVALLSAADDDMLPSCEIRIEIAKLCVQVNEWNAGYKVLKALLLEDDGNGFVWYLLAECSRRIGRTRRALRHLRRAVGIAQRVAQGSEHDTAEEEGGPAEFLRKAASLEAELLAELGGTAPPAADGEDWVTDSDEEREKESELLQRISEEGGTCDGDMDMS